MGDGIAAFDRLVRAGDRGYGSRWEERAMVTVGDESEAAPESRREGDEPGIKLDQFLKWSGITPTGGQAKILIQEGAVQVNGEVETRRGRRLRRGDRVLVGGRTLTVDVT